MYLVSLIEHKSGVDYDIMMQLLRCMVCIWHEYMREREREKEGISRQKNFRYPPILPIVYYEGSGSWTVSQRLSDRIQQSDVFGRYVPDFRYEVVRIHGYSNEELLKRGDEMSLIMLLNKLQKPEDFRELYQSPPEKLAEVLKNADPHIVRLIEDIMYSLMMKMNVPAEEAREYVGAIGGKQMGYLFERMEKMDIQAERRNTAEARQRAEEAEKRADEAESRADEAESRVDEAWKHLAKVREHAKESEMKLQESEYKAYIAACKSFKCGKEEAAKRLVAQFPENLGNDFSKALEKAEQYWDGI